MALLPRLCSPTVVLILVKQYFEWPDSIVAVFSLAVSILAEHTEKQELLRVYLCVLSVISLSALSTTYNAATIKLA